MHVRWADRRREFSECQGRVRTTERRAGKAKSAKETEVREGAGRVFCCSEDLSGEELSDTRKCGLQVVQRWPRGEQFPQNFGS